MANATYWQRGESLDYTNGSGSKITAGTIILLTDMVGVAGADIPDGATGSVEVTGVFIAPKEYAASGKALTIGQAVVWDDTNGYFKAATTTVHGHVVKAALTTDETCYVKINA